MIKIQQHVFHTEGIVKHLEKIDDQPTKKISKAKWLQLYDKSFHDKNIVFIRPLTVR